MWCLCCHAWKQHYYSNKLKSFKKPNWLEATSWLVVELNLQPPKTNPTRGQRSKHNSVRKSPTGRRQPVTVGCLCGTTDNNLAREQSRVWTQRAEVTFGYACCDSCSSFTSLIQASMDLSEHSQIKSNQMLVFGERGTWGKTCKNRVENPYTQARYGSGSGNQIHATMVEGKCFHHYAIPAFIKVLFLTPYQGWVC